MALTFHVYDATAISQKERRTNNNNGVFDLDSVVEVTAQALLSNAANSVAASTAPVTARLPPNIQATRLLWQFLQSRVAVTIGRSRD